ncbi:MAG: SH3 domain-containing protein [Fusobacteria bacterium]|nr:MAG: SH3 domain-containing protein [Fusobacteriota bacterium]KAF0227911.1 MAG: SH3 domain-containing [Fusobacteriota bacterium]
MGWAKNGENAGTSGYGYRIEAMKVVLVEKGAAAPDNLRSYIVLTNPLNVPIISQRPELPTGCEVTSLAMILNYLGVNVTKIQLANEIPYHQTNPDLGFVGSPFNSYGYTIFPPALMNIMEKYAGSAVNLTGSGTIGIKNSINQGKPVLVWARLSGFYLHAVVITGYNNDGFYYNDPWTGKKNAYINNSAFNTAWNTIGNRALSY